MDLEFSCLIILRFFQTKSRPEWDTGVRCDPEHGSAGTTTQKLTHQQGGPGVWVKDHSTRYISTQYKYARKSLWTLFG